MSATIVQYVIVRGDLLRSLGWPVGAVVAQACHATTACVHQFHEDPDTKNYLADVDNMHKVVLEAPDETSIRKLHSELDTDGIKHKLWIEQPENIPTCIALKPYYKDQVQKYFKKLKLFNVKSSSE